MRDWDNPNLIYAPAEVYDLRLALASGLFAAASAALEDFVAQANKPWAYYLGVGIGGAATATGIPGAAATIYVIGEGVDALLFHSPDGSLVDVYLDGIFREAVEAYDPVAGWVNYSLVLIPGIQHRIDFVNTVPATGNVSGISWMGLDVLSVLNGTAQPKGSISVANVSFSYSVLDADGHTKSIAFQAPLVAQTLTGLTAAAQGLATDIDACIDGVITSITVGVATALPGGIKSTAVANCDIEKGALLTFIAANTPYVWSAFFPTWKNTLLAADTVTNTGTAATLITALVTGIGAGGELVQFSNPYGNDLTAYKAGSERFRK